jgi:hypothetical protein
MQSPRNQLVVGVQVFSTHAPSLATVILKLLLKQTMYAIAIYVVQRTRPLLNTPMADSLRFAMRLHAPLAHHQGRA